MVIILVYHLIMRSAPPTIFSPKKKEKKNHGKFLLVIIWTHNKKLFPPSPTIITCYLEFIMKVLRKYCGHNNILSRKVNLYTIL